MIIGVAVVLVGIGLIGYGIWNFTLFLFPTLRKSKSSSAQPINPFIEAHQIDDRNKTQYEEYLKWAHDNNKPVIFDFESFQDKVNKKQDSKIKRLFK